MMPDTRRFPDALFPKSSTKWKGNTVVDLGVNDAVDIDVAEQQIKIHSRKAFEIDDCEKYRPCDTSLPLANPNNIGKFSTAEEIRDYAICQHERNVHVVGREVKTNNKAQINKLLIDNPEMLLGSIMNEMKQPNLDLLSRNFHPLKYACDVPVSYKKWIRPPDDYKKFFKEKSHAMKHAFVRFSNKRPLESKDFVKKLDDLSDAIFEIPRSILLDYLDEELVMKYDELTKNHHLGNCLAKNKDYLIYPKGDLDSVAITPFKAEKHDRNFVIEADTDKSQTIMTKSRIMEISCVEYKNQNSFMGIRSDYCCSFLSDSYQQPQEENKYFSVVDEVHTNSKIISMAINPYFTNDAFILVEDGSFQCWADGHLSFVGDNQMINYSNENHVCWVNCIYGSNPRSILFLNSDEALLYDMRTPRRSRQLVLQLPNPCLNRMDKLGRPASLHPSNPHHILLTSDQGLIVVDERFINNPLITINHYMRDSPQFMQTLTAEDESTVRTLAFLGGHRHRDTRCVEFEERLMRRTNFYHELSRQEYMTQPPVSTRMPWKLSAPDSWLRSITNDIRITSPAVAKRLKQPLIGLNVAKIEAPSRNDLVAIQLTKTGDLFYQMLIKGNSALGRVESEAVESEAVHSSDESVSGTTLERKLKKERPTSFSNKAQKECLEWIKMAFEMYNKDLLVNEKANLCTTLVDTSSGSITKAFERQIESRECFKKAHTEVASLIEDNDHLMKGRDREGRIQNDVNEESKTRNGNSRVKIDKSNREKVNVFDSLDKEDDEPEFETAVEFCPICKRPLEQEVGKCDGCNLDIGVSSKVYLAYMEGCVLSNKILGQNLEQPNMNFVKHPERSKDPLSVVLLANWENDDFYTPLDLSTCEGKNISNEDRNDGGLCRKKKKRRNEEDNEEITGSSDDFDENDDGWYLSSSGNLEFGRMDPHALKKEPDLDVGMEGRMTRSRSRALARPEEKRKNRIEKCRKRRAKYSGKKLAAKSGEKSLVRTAEKVLKSNMNQAETVSTGSSLIKNVEKLVESDNSQTKVVSFSDPGTSLELSKRSSDQRSKIKDPASLIADETNKLNGDDIYKEDFLLSPATLTMPLQLNSSSPLVVDTSFDSSIDLLADKGQQPKSQSIIDDSSPSAYDLENMNTPTKIYSSVKVRRTPRKKKIAREMGF